MRKHTAPDTLYAVERRQLAVVLRRSGLTYPRIAERMQCTPQNAHKLVKAALADARSRLAEDTDMLRALECERLDALQHALWERAAQGQPMAILGVLKLMEQRARLLGLYQAAEAPPAAQLVAELLAKLVVVGGPKREYIDSLRRVHQLGQAARGQAR